MNEPITDPQQTNPLRPPARLKRKILLWLGLFMLFQFWDSLLGMALHALHILIEYLELALEHLWKSFSISKVMMARWRPPGSDCY